MKNFKYILGIIGLLILGSCQKSNTECPLKPIQKEYDYVRFFGSISKFATRAGETKWNEGDAIGIYAISSGKTLSQGIYDNKRNIKYTTSGSEKFSISNLDEEIKFPKDNLALDFISYYPYKDIVQNNIISVDVTDQSVPSAIDLLYSNNSRNNDNTVASASLSFKHMLSKIVLNIKVKDSSSLSGLTSTIENAIVDGSFNLENGVITTGNTKKTIVPKIYFSEDKSTAKITAILLPGQSLDNLNLKVILNGKKYNWSPQGNDMASTTKYTYDLTLEPNENSIKAVKITGTIQDWIEGNPGGVDITIQPDKQETSQFSVDRTSISIQANSDLLQNININTATSQEWTVETDATWLTLDKTEGTGSSSISITAQQNTESERTATVIFKTSDHDDVVVNVTQIAGETGGSSTPASGNALFPGSDFEDWTAFTQGLNRYGLKDYVTKSSDGRNGTTALFINGTPKGNDYIFTVEVPSEGGIKNKEKISFYVKGKATGKSMSINLYKSTLDGKGHQEYYKFNIETLGSSDVTIEPSSRNSYTGDIDTQREWVKITLNISGLSDLATTGNLFAVKVGKGVAWNILIDDIEVE